MKWQLLHQACWAGDAAEVARLLEAGADPNHVAPTDWRQTPLGRTLEYRISSPRHAGHVETVRVLLRGGARPGVRSTSLDMTPYELASFCGLDAAAELLRGFAAETAHPTGMTELWLAAASRLPEAEQASVVRELAKLSDVNAVWRTATPLMMAAGHAGHFRVADELLAAGADVDAGTSLLHACCDWHFECLGPGLDYLVRAGWNVNSHDAQGQTALHKAAFLGYTATLRTLLEQGANPDARDADGLTARDLALQWKKGPAIKVLA